MHTQNGPQSQVLQEVKYFTHVTHDVQPVSKEQMWTAGRPGFQEPELSLKRLRAFCTHNIQKAIKTRLIIYETMNLNDLCRNCGTLITSFFCSLKVEFSEPFYIVGVQLKSLRSFIMAAHYRKTPMSNTE